MDHQKRIAPAPSSWVLGASTSGNELDAALARILAEPSHAHRFVTGIADVLDNDPFLTVNALLVADAMNAAARHVFTGLPDIVAAQASETAIDELPETYPGELAGSLAARIRAAAEDLR
jgi:hypothetical protein